jgi:hypothetical protein
MPNSGSASYTPGCNDWTYVNTNDNYQALYTTVAYTDPTPLPGDLAEPWSNYTNHTTNNMMWFPTYGPRDHDSHGYETPPQFPFRPQPVEMTPARAMTEPYAGETYQRAMNLIFHDLLGIILEIYIDDVVVKSDSMDNHLADLYLALKRMRRYGLKINSLKCVFGVSTGKFLGFIIYEHGIEIDPKKIESIQKVQPP